MDEILHTQMICNRVYALIDGILLELERVCDEHEETDTDIIADFN